MTVRAWLEGEQFDLLDLADSLSEGDVRVVRDDAEDAYYLTAPELDNPPDGKTFFDVGPQLLTWVNGLGRVSKSDFRPVRLTGRYGTPQGQHIAAAASAEGRLHARCVGVVANADGSVVRVPSPWPGYIALAGTDRLVAWVLSIMGTANKQLDWYDLFKVYELIKKKALANGDTIVKRRWASTNDVTAFTTSANNYQVSGDAARHAVDGGTLRSTTPTMSIEEGRDFIGRISRQWLESLAAAPPSE